MVDLDEMRLVLDRVEDLPTLPTIYLEISNLLQDPKTGFEEVARVVEIDQVITAKILKLVNSSFFGFGRQVTSIRQAVVLLGFNTIKNTALSVEEMEQVMDDNKELFFNH